MPEYRRVPPQVPWSTVLQVFGGAILVLTLLYVIWNGLYTVQPHEQAVLLRFGKFAGTTGPGLHFMMPLVNEVVKVDVAEKSMRLPYGMTVRVRDDEPDLMQQRNQEEALILTGDLYAAVVEWNVMWRVVEPKDFVFSINEMDIESTIIAVARSVMHQVVGDYSADEILTGKREEIGLAALEQMQRALDVYQCGVAIVGLQMQRVTPPERVKPAFDDVNASIQQRDQLVNEANKERNQLIPKAEIAADRLIREAEGYAARRRAEAEGEISALLAKYRAYQNAPDITRQRLYLEAMEEVLGESGPKTVLDDNLRGLLPLLNLQSGGDEDSDR